LRVIDSPGQTWGYKETALNWNAQGPQGPAGPQGPPGASGVSGYEVVTVHDPARSGDADITVTCPSGRKALVEAVRRPHRSRALGLSFPLDRSSMGRDGESSCAARAAWEWQRRGRLRHVRSRVTPPVA
jgi:hypothetical protein